MIDLDINSMYAHKIELNVSYGKLIKPMDQLTRALNNAWEAWYANQIGWVDHPSFEGWVRREGGFEFDSYDEEHSEVTTVHDEQKYAWFLLKWG